jgi:hypothetical protein
LHDIRHGASVTWIKDTSLNVKFAVSARSILPPSTTKNTEVKKSKRNNLSGSYCFSKDSREVRLCHVVAVVIAKICNILHSRLKFYGENHTPKDHFRLLK